MENSSQRDDLCKSNVMNNELGPDMMGDGGFVLNSEGNASFKGDKGVFGNEDKESVKENGINENESGNKNCNNSSEELIDNEINTSIGTG
ncbi:hypothetical protein Tco_0549905, partial [Tanacetum coccineum]